MYTRCPQCKTTFAVTEALLEERGGVVRCGHCARIFRADQNLVKSLDDETGNTAAVDNSHAIPESGGVTDLAPAAPDVAVAESPKAETGSRKLSREELAQTLDALLGRTRRRPEKLWLWTLTSVLLVFALLLQLAYYNRNSWSYDPRLAPYLRPLAKALNWPLEPRRDEGLIELTDTLVLAHPKYDGVLRVKATLINRAQFTQPFPTLEITLTDRRGEVAARRHYPPEEYLSKKQLELDGMSLNVATRIQLDIKSPGPQIEGFEIRVIAQR